MRVTLPVVSAEKLESIKKAIFAFLSAMLVLSIIGFLLGEEQLCIQFMIFLIAMMSLSIIIAVWIEQIREFF